MEGENGRAFQAEGTAREKQRLEFTFTKGTLSVARVEKLRWEKIQTKAHWTLMMKDLKVQDLFCSVDNGR